MAYDSISLVYSEDRLKRAIVSPQVPISKAMLFLDYAGTGILLLAEDDRQLVGVVTDGDIRRAILRGVSLDQPCVDVANCGPLTAPSQITSTEALHLMDHGRGFVVNHLPLLGAKGRVVGLLLRSDLISEDQLGPSAVIMAGGLGTRLQPLTNDLPKPMLPLGDRPLLEFTLNQLRLSGIQRVNISTHFQSQKIEEYFGDGRSFGVELNYVTEDRPLGTAGALALIDARDEPLLVINGDILTRVDFRAMLHHHRSHHAELTVGVRRYGLQVPYGVIECDGPFVKWIREKPQLDFLVNAGIYLLEPSVPRCISPGQHLDMTDLIHELLEEGRPVVGFPIVEYWLDIGQPIDYEKAQADMRSGRF